jgi:hypothetical protein
MLRDRHAVDYAKFLQPIHMMPSFGFTMTLANVIETHEHTGEFKDS